MSKLYRSRRDAKLFGVCGGLAESMNVDPTLVRIVVVVTTFFSAGTIIPLYLIASMVIPKEPLFNDPNISGGFHHHGPGGGFSRNPGSFNHSNFHTSKGGYSGPSGPSGHSGYPGYSGPPPQYRPNDPYAENTNSGRQTTSNLDDMMKDIEKKAMQKELEELRARLAKLENQKNDPRGDE